MHNSEKIPALSTQIDNIQTPITPQQKMAIDTKTLFAYGNVVYLQHQGECYLLRRTRNGKLILTK
ncbi:Hemin uptake protein HemP [Nitrosomonas aestuarii]|uniref:Hemin uptake protein HemP n=1 Tax=Nitrosomonas aestuarii TaxID=52441 RepID=A0A1I3WYA7_9PROT|nr:hemin uptake protein HemP [Nitrosomonas aestuarii]SFK12119.1 Hemin uptake protein HemP [Nitrosomonas aestuarii]